MNLATIYTKFRDKLANEKTQHQGKIFHYTSAIGLKSIVENESIWFSNLRYLNDSSESNYIYSLFPKKAVDAKLDESFFKMICDIKNSFECNKDYRFSNNSFSQKDFYVASFSKAADCLELWNYYTKSDDSIGYNLGFDQSCLFIINLYSIKGEVIYDKTKQVELLDEILKEYNDYYVQNKTFSKEDKEVFIKNFIGIIELHNLFFKHPEFKNEQEYRYVIGDTNDNGTTDRLILQYLKNRIHNGLFIPYLEIPYEKSCLRSIGISPNKDNSLFESGIRFFLRNQKVGIEQIKSSKIPKRY